MTESTVSFSDKEICKQLHKRLEDQLSGLDSEEKVRAKALLALFAFRGGTVTLTMSDAADLSLLSRPRRK